MNKSPDTINTKDPPLQVVSQGIHSAHPCCLVVLWLKYHHCIILKQVLYYLHGRRVCFLHDSVWLSRTVVYLPARLLTLESVGVKACCVPLRAACVITL